MAETLRLYGMGFEEAGDCASKLILDGIANAISEVLEVRDE
jgi:hypothetical protein